MTAKELIEALGGYVRVAERLGIESFNVRGYCYRGHIPVKYWPIIIQLAKEAGLEGVDAHMLMTLWIRGH